MVKYVRPVAKRLYDVPLPGDDYFQAIEDLFERLQGVDQLLMNPKITSVRLVTNPEKIVLKETQRAFMYFCLFKMNIDAIVINRILPRGLTDAYFKDWLKSQQQRLEEARDYFDPIPIFSVNQFKGEIVGYDRLKILADQVYGKRNPIKRFYKEEPYELIKKNGNYRLKLKLPFVMKKDVELNKFIDELIVRIGGFKRHILLPRQVASMQPVKATLEDQILQIYFEGEYHGPEKE